MSVLWKVTSRVTGQEKQHRKVDIDERICDIAPVEEGMCGFRLYSWIQAQFTPEIPERIPRRMLMATGARDVHARIPGSQPVTFKAPLDVTVDELNSLAKDALCLSNSTMPWADHLDGASACWTTPRVALE